jgi:hypothetical protein
MKVRGVKKEKIKVKLEPVTAPEEVEEEEVKQEVYTTKLEQSIDDAFEEREDDEDYMPPLSPLKSPPARLKHRPTSTNAHKGRNETSKRKKKRTTPRKLSHQRSSASRKPVCHTRQIATPFKSSELKESALKRTADLAYAKRLLELEREPIVSVCPAQNGEDPPGPASTRSRLARLTMDEILASITALSNPKFTPN